MQISSRIKAKAKQKRTNLEPNSIKNRSEIYQKSIKSEQNRKKAPKRAQERHKALGPQSSSALGAVLGRLGLSWPLWVLLWPIICFPWSFWMLACCTMINVTSSFVLPSLFLLFPLLPFPLPRHFQVSLSKHLFYGACLLIPFLFLFYFGL